MSADISAVEAISTEDLIDGDETEGDPEDKVMLSYKKNGLMTLKMTSSICRKMAVSETKMLVLYLMT